MEATLIVKSVDRGMRVDYIPVNDLAKLVAQTCGRKSLSIWQLKIWHDAGARVLDFHNENKQVL